MRQIIVGVVSRCNTWAGLVGSIKTAARLILAAIARHEEWLAARLAKFDADNMPVDKAATWTNG